MKDRESKIRNKAYDLWDQEGRPEGRATIHWDMASELVAIEENQKLATKPVGRFGPEGEPIEEAAIMQNLGEFPTLTDQGEEQTAPSRKKPSTKAAANTPKRKVAAAGFKSPTKKQ